MITAKNDKFFITEILNDLHRNGFIRQGKAETMLRDWAVELRKKARTQLAASRLRKTFNTEIGADLW